MSSVEIAIRSIQHYLYCPHRWGLLEIDKAWEENIFVTKANLMHKRVHDQRKIIFLEGKKFLHQFRYIMIWNPIIYME